MKQKYLGFLIVLCSFLTMTISQSVHAESLLKQTEKAGYSLTEDNLPEAGIVIDGENGQVLWQENAGEKINPGDLSRLMTLYLTFEAIDDGTLALDTVITTTETQEAISKLPGMVNTPVVAGVQYQVADLIQLSLFTSSTVATIMLANTLEEHDGAFVQRMNNKADELGMTQTSFNTVTGIPAENFQGYYQPKGFDIYGGNLTTAGDLALLTYHLLKNYPDCLDMTKETQTHILSDSLYEESFESKNQLLPGKPFETEGVNGLLLGDNDLGFNGIFTAQRNNWKAITVLLGAGNPGSVDSDQALYAVGKTLIDQTFQTYSYEKVLDAGEQTLNGQTLTVQNDFYAVMKKNTKPELTVDENSVTLNNALPVISDKTDPLEIAYSTKEQELEQELEGHSFINYLLSVFQITKWTILAVGILVLGLIFLLMALFIPSKATRIQKQTDNATEKTSKRSDRLVQFPYKSSLTIIGLATFLIGVVILSIQYFV